MPEKKLPGARPPGASVGGIARVVKRAITSSRNPNTGTIRPTNPQSSGGQFHGAMPITRRLYQANKYPSNPNATAITAASFIWADVSPPDAAARTGAALHIPITS
ncbi:MAG TPA: hypothetical protein VKA05_06825 [Acidimicrobiales bacterium]|nr:hypothetical protein [Acidimicrobiales bacterium]